MKIIITEEQYRLIKESYNEYEVIDKDTFEDALLDLATLDLEDDQVRYPKVDDAAYLFSGKIYDVFVNNRDELPNSGPFELIIEDNDEQYIGFARATKGNDVVSFNMIHIKDEYRGKGIGTDIYEWFLDNGYIIRSDDEITDMTYSMYTRLESYGYTPILFSDGRVGLKK